MDALDRKTNVPVESRAETPNAAGGHPIPISTTEPPLKSETGENTLLLLAEAVRDAPTVERPRRPAEFVPRAVASVVDGCLLLFLWFLLFIVSNFAVRALRLRVHFDSDWILVGALITVALLYPCTEVFGAATPGKVLARLQVARPDGSAAPKQVRLKRWAIRVSPLLLGCVAVAIGAAASGFPAAPASAAAVQLQNLSEAVGCASILALVVLALGTLASLAPDGRALHDYLSGTAVYQAVDVKGPRGPASRGFQPVMSVERRDS